MKSFIQYAWPTSNIPIAYILDENQDGHSAFLGESISHSSTAASMGEHACTCLN